MNTYKIINLVTLNSRKVTAMSKDAALATAREQGFTAMFFTIEGVEHKPNRWNTNRGYV